MRDSGINWVIDCPTLIFMTYIHQLHDNEEGAGNEIGILL